MSAAKSVAAPRFDWGHLRDHEQYCKSCEGTGVLDTDDEDNCLECDGEGQWRWGSFYADAGPGCGYCGGETVQTGEMYDAHHHEDCFVCLVCYLKHHKERCGCDLWMRAESAVLGEAEHQRLADACSRYIHAVDPDWTGDMPSWFEEQAIAEEGARLAVRADQAAGYPQVEKPMSFCTMIKNDAVHMRACEEGRAKCRIQKAFDEWIRAQPPPPISESDTADQGDHHE